MTAESLTLTDFLLARIAEDIAGIAYIDGVNWTGERVLAECEAKRRIVEAYAEAEAGHNRADGSVSSADAMNIDGLHLAARLLATAYADHPDYREEWRP